MHGVMAAGGGVWRANARSWQNMGNLISGDNIRE